MRHKYPFVFASCALISSALPLLSQNAGDGSDLFLSAYSNYQKAEALEKKGDKAAALALFEEVNKTLNQLSSQYPNWNPQVVKMRAQYTAQSIQKLRASNPGVAASSVGTTPSVAKQKATETEAPSPAKVTSRSATPPVSAAPAPAPGKETGTSGIPKLPERGGVPVAPADPFAEIQAKLSQLQNDLQFALEEAQRLRKEKADLAAQLAEMTQGRQKAESETRLLEQRSDIAEKALMLAREQNMKAVEEITVLQKDRDVLRVEKRQLQAEKDASEELRRRLEGRLAQTQSRETAVAAERDSANQKLGDATKQITQLQGAVDKEVKDKSTVQTKLEKALGERDDARKLVETAMKERDSEKTAREQFAKEKDAKEKSLIQAGMERDAAKAALTKVTQERDDAVALAAKLKDARIQIDRLEGENRDFSAKLAKAQQQLEQKRQEGTQSTGSMKALRDEVESIRTKLTDSQKKAEASQKSVVELQGKLDAAMKEGTKVQADLKTAQSDLNAAKTDLSTVAAERDHDREEKDILQGILRRSLVEQSKRDEARKALVAEVARLKIDSDVLSSQIGMLAEPVVQLSDKERAMFKQPVVDISEGGISISAIKTPSKTASAKQQTPSPGAAMPAPAPATKPDSKDGKDAKSSQGSSPAGPSVAGPGAAAPSPSPSTAPKEPAAAANPSDTFRTKLAEAKEYFEKNNFDASEKAYLEALALAPDNAFVLSNLGVTQFRAKRYSKAEQSLRKAIELAPQDAFSRSTLGIVYYTQGNLDKSIEELTQSVGISPNNSVAHNYLGIAASRKGWQESARKHLETAAALDPNYADAFFNLAVVCISQTPPDKEAARAAYKKATALGAEADSRLEDLIR